MKRLQFQLPVLSLALCPPAHSGSVHIQSCYAGDTCRTTSDEGIRLACIDTPERDEYGASGSSTAWYYQHGFIESLDFGWISWW